MKVTDSMRRCLIPVDQHGEAIRFWHGSRADEWSWHINRAPMTQQVHRCIRVGLISAASRDRVVLSDLGQRVLVAATWTGRTAKTVTASGMLGRSRTASGRIPGRAN